MKFQNYEEAEKKYGVGGSSDWMSLQEGNNKIRIVSEFSDYAVHWNNKEKKSIICVGKKKSCVVCEYGDKPKVQYLGWVIDRTDKKFKLLRIGHQIFKQIGELAVNDEYKFNDIPNYDITIARKGADISTEYAVIPSRKDSKLTVNEQKEINKLKDPEEIIEKMKQKQVEPESIDDSASPEPDPEPDPEPTDTKNKKVRIDDIPF